MKIHKEGKDTLAISFVILAILNVVSYLYLLPMSAWAFWAVLAVSAILYLFIVSFFRIPARQYSLHDEKVISPCDGKVVVIEEVVDPEYFKEKKLQISIFMSPANVHVNRNPVSGEVVYSQYHKGKYLVAWNPKSSTENERHSVVYKTPHGHEVLAKQIAGALAKRIVNYLKPGMQVKQCDEMGFIKFGSRVDLLLPLDAEINVKLNEVVKGGISVIAKI